MEEKLNGVGMRFTSKSISNNVYQEYTTSKYLLNVWQLNEFFKLLHCFSKGFLLLCTEQKVTPWNPTNNFLTSFSLQTVHVYRDNLSRCIREPEQKLNQFNINFSDTFSRSFWQINDFSREGGKLNCFDCCCCCCG